MGGRFVSGIFFQLEHVLIASGPNIPENDKGMKQLGRLDFLFPAGQCHHSMFMVYCLYANPFCGGRAVPHHAKLAAILA
jgi:hypothetical protein